MDHESASPEERRAVHRFHNELLHLVSLMYALMIKHLRQDFDLSTVYTHDMAGKPPYMDSNVGVHGWSRWEVFMARVLALNDLFKIHNPQQQAEIPVIGGLRDEECVRLADLVPTPAMKGGHGVLGKRWGNILVLACACFSLEGRGAAVNGARPYAVFALIYQLYIRRIKEGGLQTHPPLVARLGGIAEEGMAAFGHCAKLANTQFPFAWAQVVMAFLAIMMLLLPFVVTNFVEELWMGVVLSFVVVLTYWSLNEVASEMEDPFGFDPNDLPLARYAFDFNQVECGGFKFTFDFLKSWGWSLGSGAEDRGILVAVHQLRPPYFDELDIVGPRGDQHQQQSHQ
ncbi:hypothetical protein VOLCADRAFT_87886 [Volvox carteri f. nagariensis]|uniref:Uncharacterized protein n=1 Tax=Volvox carteri f. nagariensis TaxID=3068 RepID=D8TMI0_VOLCA|nr:uncharacterized protein VOLCADRAFT_87886 [Volvox carteri f. nagariensis]EFJ51126.1 hypothetical protein VOLCADRAFT_87886 [Volvox carteri f. nagariensis]|eukprot:XP_002947593.1 hypothetical protein VOLCADRAFT_87886 [Volvox carteri f. nagariensis]